MHATNSTNFATIITDAEVDIHRRRALASMRGGGECSGPHAAFYRQSQTGSGKPVAKQGVFATGSKTPLHVAFWDYTDGTRDEFDGQQWHRGTAGRQIVYRA